MASNKNNGVQRIPKDTVLKELGISKASMNILTRKFNVPIDVTDEIKPHNSVVKLHRSMSGTFESKANDKRLDRSLKILDKMDSSHNTKLDELKLSKEKYQNNLKLEHEREAIKRREDAKRRRSVRLMDVALTEEAQMARSVYDIAVQDVKVKTAKQQKASKKGNVKEETGFQLSNDIKKLRISMTSNSKTPSIEGFMKNARFENPASQFFARELGWIEDNRSKNIGWSPLKNYKTEDKVEDKKLEQEEKNVDIKEINNSKDTENIEYAPVEMDMEEILRLERKYKKESEEIRKNMEKSNRDFDKKVVSISKIYDKLVGPSVAVKVSEGKIKDTDKTAEIDISKIPSFVLEETKRTKTQKK